MTETEPTDAEIPTWKAEFLSKPSISVRKGTADNYDAPFEDTSTLVLTALSGKFVDIRFPTQILSDESGRDKPLISHSSFWAFSGISSTTFYDPEDRQPGFEYTAHTVFTHDIDSKGPGITDEGDCFLLPNGDVMEIGISSSTKELYKEVWTSPEPLPGMGAVQKFPVIVAESVGSDSGGGRGIIIRIGDYIQGLYEREDDSHRQGKVLVRRMINTDMGWIDDLRNSTCDDSLMPCETLMGLDSCRLNMKWSVDAGEWQITEFQA